MHADPVLTISARLPRSTLSALSTRKHAATDAHVFNFLFGNSGVGQRLAGGQEREIPHARARAIRREIKHPRFETVLSEANGRLAGDKPAPGEFSPASERRDQTDPRHE